MTAAPAEGRAVAAGLGVSPPVRDWEIVEKAGGWAMVQSGVGKVNGALCVARCVREGGFERVVNVGVCGALPGEQAAKIGDVIVADVCVYADEGIATEGGFTDIAAAGFPPGGWSVNPEETALIGCRVETSAAWSREIAAHLLALGAPVRVSGIATVSACSGTDALARAVAERTGAIGEGMEGAAVGHAITRLHGTGVMFAEVRIVSNTTGDRARQVWDLKGALARLTEVVSALASRAS